MASNDDECLMSSNNKRPRMDIINLYGDKVSSSPHCSIDELSPPSPDNLEYLPVEMLMRIFADVDDNDLLNLTTISCRFRSVATVVFTDRYAGKYFTVDNESDRQQEIYERQFSSFGSGIRAIKAIGIQGIDKSHWMAQMICEHIGDRLQKLEFRNCTFRNGCDMLMDYMGLTHLTIFGGDCGDNHWIHLPKYQNLQKFELRNFQFVTELTIDWMLRNNPHLESLIFHHASHDFSMAKLMEYVHKYEWHLKEFIVLDCIVGTDFPTGEQIEQFLIETTGLESLGFTIQTQHMDLNERLNANSCKNIKHLELLHLQNSFATMELNYVMAVARKFQNIERLSLNMDYVYNDTAPILALLESLPCLRYLYIPQMKKNLPEWTMTLIQRCEHLEQLVISIGDGGRPDEYQIDVFHHHINAHFHGQFLDAKRKGNVEIEFMENGRTIGRVTKQEIVWRNKLVYWTGYDSICSNSKVDLLDLADQATNDAGASPKTEQRNPFDLILNYLDLNSLYAVHECNSRSKQLVEDYVKRHSEQGDAFLITDEFYMNCNGLKHFASHVKNLHVKLFDRYTSYMVKFAIGTYYENLTTLCFRTRFSTRPDEFIFPHVEHLFHLLWR